MMKLTSVNQAQDVRALVKSGNGTGCGLIQLNSYIYSSCPSV